MAFDAARQEVVVFGGITSVCVAGLVGAVIYGIYLLTQ